MRYNFYLDIFFDKNLIYFLSRKLSIKTEIEEGSYKKVLASSLYQNKFEEDFLENIKQKALCTNNKSILIYSFEIKKSIPSFPRVDDIVVTDIADIMKVMKKNLLPESQVFALPEDTHLTFLVKKHKNTFELKLYSMSEWLYNDYLNYLATGEINYLSY